MDKLKIAGINIVAIEATEGNKKWQRPWKKRLQEYFG